MQSSIKGATTSLADIPYDPNYAKAAHNAIYTCLRVQPGERATLITDNATIEIAASLFEELLKAGAEVHTFVVEDYSARPLSSPPTSHRFRARKAEYSRSEWCR